MAAILVVDDEAEIRDLIRRVLARAGHHVDLAIHGAAALETVQGRSYDLVICNIRMPVMDGPTFYAHVCRSNPVLASCFVFCTGDIVSPIVRTFLASTSQPVLAKPFSIVGLRSLVEHALESFADPRRPSIPCAEEWYTAATGPG